MTEHQLHDSWASLAETTHDRIEEAEQRGDVDRANALMPVFQYCFLKALQTHPTSSYENFSLLGAVRHV